VAIAATRLEQESFCALSVMAVVPTVSPHYDSTT
jgi:hypothetical protein